MKKYLIIALIVLPLPLYLFGVVVLHMPRPVDYVSYGSCNIFDMGEVCSDSVRREINIVGTIFASTMLASFLVGVGLVVRTIVRHRVRQVLIRRRPTT